MPGSSSGMTAWAALWTQSPVKLVKIIFKKQPVKFSVNGFRIYSKWINIYSRKSTQTQNSESLCCLNQDLLPFCPLSVQWDKLHSRLVHPRKQGSLFSQLPEDYHPGRDSTSTFLILPPAVIDETKFQASVVK